MDLYFEAAVAGAIPLVRPVRESLAGDAVTRVLGIVNGTTNYVLDQMASTGADLDLAVKQAQELGYAEADPTADVEGYDAAAKAAILASLAFHTRVSVDQVHREGIGAVTAEDVAWAAETGHVVKLLAVAERVAATAEHPEGVVVRVHPALVPLDHPLAGVHQAFNAVFVEADAAGELMFYGRGAGGRPTASAVLGDVVTVAAAPGAWRPRTGRVALRRPAGARHGGCAHPLPGAACGSRTVRACSPRSPRCSPRATCPSRRSGRPTATGRPTCWSSPTPPPRVPWPPRSRT